MCGSAEKKSNENLDSDFIGKPLDRKPECASRESHPEIIGNGMVECRSCYQIGLFHQTTRNLEGGR